MAKHTNQPYGRKEKLFFLVLNEKLLKMNYFIHKLWSAKYSGIYGKKDKKTRNRSGGQRWRSKEKPSYHGTTVSENQSKCEVATEMGLRDGPWELGLLRSDFNK